MGLVGCLFPAAARAQTSDNLLLVVNDNSPASGQIAEYYARKRAVGTDHIVHIKTVSTDNISRADYNQTIELPIGNWLSMHSLQDKVLYVVLTKGVPLRVDGTDGPQGTVASVDSELTLLYQKLLGAQPLVPGRMANPYFLGDKPLAEARPFTRVSREIYLVTRLDGFSVDDVLKLIDRGAAPSHEGQIVLDEKATLIDRGGDRWLQDAADQLRRAGAGDRVLLETTQAIASAPGPVMGTTRGARTTRPISDGDRASSLFPGRSAAPSSAPTAARLPSRLPTGFRATRTAAAPVSAAAFSRSRAT